MKAVERGVAALEHFRGARGSIVPPPCFPTRVKTHSILSILHNAITVPPAKQASKSCNLHVYDIYTSGWSLAERSVVEMSGHVVASKSVAMLTFCRYLMNQQRQKL